LALAPKIRTSGTKKRTAPAPNIQNVYSTTPCDSPRAPNFTLERRRNGFVAGAKYSNSPPPVAVSLILDRSSAPRIFRCTWAPRLHRVHSVVTQILRADFSNCTPLTQSQREPNVDADTTQKGIRTYSQRLTPEGRRKIRKKIEMLLDALCRGRRDGP
jgi:hypothetical protein